VVPKAAKALEPAKKKRAFTGPPGARAAAAKPAAPIPKGAVIVTAGRGAKSTARAAAKPAAKSAVKSARPAAAAKPKPGGRGPAR